MYVAAIYYQNICIVNCCCGYYTCDKIWNGGITNIDLFLGSLQTGLQGKRDATPLCYKWQDNSWCIIVCIVVVANNND